MRFQSCRTFILSFMGSYACWTGIFVAFGIFHLLTGTLNNAAKTEFEHQTNNIYSSIQTRVQSYIHVLRSTAALFNANTGVTRGEFHVYVSSMGLKQNFPGIHTVNFAQYVPASQRAEFEKTVREDTSLAHEGYPDFRITPPGERNGYTVLVYLEPMKHRPAVFGHDLSSDQPANEALALARDSGKIISSGRIIRVNNSKSVAGMAMGMAVYRYGMPLGTVEQRRAAYYGSVGIGFDINQLILEAIGKPDNLKHIRVKVTDNGPGAEFRDPGYSGEPIPVFDSLQLFPAQRESEEASDQPLRKKVGMAYTSRQWDIEFTADPAAMLSRFDRYLPYIALVSSLLATLLLYAIYYSMHRAKQRAVEMAVEMTRDLRRSEAHLTEAQQMASLGSWQLDPMDGSMQWSAETSRIFGISGGKAMYYHDYFALVHEEDRPTVREGLDNAILNGTEIDTEHRIVRTDGTVRWVHTICRPLNDGYRRLVRGTIMDITERKLAVQALQRSQELLRELTAHQDRIKEDERRRIAREIHDELGQTLLALRIDISMLDVRTEQNHPRLNARIRGVLQQLDATVRAIRSIINDLRPPVLDLGLIPAIEWQAAEFRRRHSIDCELAIGEQEADIGGEHATMMFRILQESLSNIARHSQASHAAISLYRNGDVLVLKIMDNGIGIAPEDRKKANCYGLLGIEERVLALGGQFHVHANAGKGTSLEIIIPKKNISSKLLLVDERLIAG